MSQKLFGVVALGNSCLVCCQWLVNSEKLQGSSHLITLGICPMEVACERFVGYKVSSERNPTTSAGAFCTASKCTASTEAQPGSCTYLYCKCSITCCLHVLPSILVVCLEVKHL